jgi:hypothetical protein
MATYTDGLFLLADTEEELHKIANEIGLYRRHFRDRRYKYYDLDTDEQFKSAIHAGANYSSLRDIIKRYRHLAVYNTREIRENIIYHMKGLAPSNRRLKLNFNWKKVYYILFVIFSLLIIINPNVKQFKEYIGYSEGSFSRKYNFFIFSVYTHQYYNSSQTYFAIAGNFVTID